MMQPRLLRLGLLAIAAGALLFWSRGLKERPMHQDEAIGADKFHELWASHKYTYDPFEYHGPTLNYFTLPVVWLSGAKSYPETSESTYRIVTVLFGVGLILLLRLTWNGLGWAESLCAGALIAISPAMSFYARYYIHEMLLVFFIYLAIGSGWRYSQGGRKRWAYLCGIALGLAYATKETWVLSLVAMGLGIGLALLWTKMVDLRVPEVRPLLRGKVLLGAAVVGLVVAAILFSGLFTNMRGPWDAIRTYSTYLHRSTGVGAAGIVFVPAGNLAYQAWRINYKYYADQRFNPYLYSTPVGDFMRLVDRIREVAKVSPSRKAVSVMVVSADCWPLPWYLRDFQNVWYYRNSQEIGQQRAFLMVGSADDAHLENILSEAWAPPQNFGLRRQVILSVYIEKKLWEEFLKK